MPKHLFLEGPIRSGKSTLIKKCLASCNITPGGFSCKRYLDDTGSIRAFGLVDPADQEVDGVYDPALHGDPDNGIAPEDPGIFLMKKSRGMQVDTDAFIRTGIKLLDASKNADLILMDEIGGVELMSAVFRAKLTEILAGDIPCIGVLKQLTHARTMEKRAGKENDIAQANEDLRREIIESGGIIVSFSREDLASAEKSILDFLKENRNV